MLGTNHHGHPVSFEPSFRTSTINQWRKPRLSNTTTPLPLRRRRNRRHRSTTATRPAWSKANARKASEPRSEHSLHARTVKAAPCCFKPCHSMAASSFVPRRTTRVNCSSRQLPDRCIPVEVGKLTRLAEELIYLNAPLPIARNPSVEKNHRKQHFISVMSGAPINARLDVF